MKLLARSTTPLVATGLLASLFSPAQAMERGTGKGPIYASPATRAVIEKMVEAHGGIEPWRAAKTFSFDNLFFNPLYEQMRWPSPWWASHEVIELSTRRAYHDWPLDRARLTYDGEDVWTVDWGQKNPPKMQSLFFFYFIGLPWLTQDPNVRLEEPGTAKLPGEDTQYTTVRMEFAEKPPVGKTKQDTFLLYIDPKTHRLRAYEYTVGYGAMLDLMGIPDGQVAGPMLRFLDKFAEVDGLLVPSEMHTGSPDGSQTWGYHVLMNHSLREPFDESRMNKPAKAVVDPSSAERASAKRTAMGQ